MIVNCVVNIFYDFYDEQFCKTWISYWIDLYDEDYK